MVKEKIALVTDCVSDLPDELIKKYNIDIFRFYISTDTGRFRDKDEISAENVYECLKRGDSVYSEEPLPDEVRVYFSKTLEKFDKIIYIAASSKVNRTYEYALKVLEKMEHDRKKIRVIDSEQISLGLGALVIRAAELRDMGYRSNDIADTIELMKGVVRSTFVVDDIDHLYRNRRVTKGVSRLCRFLSIHPVIIMKDGYMRLKKVYLGDFIQVSKKYIRYALKRYKNKGVGFVYFVNSGCGRNNVRLFSEEIKNYSDMSSVISVDVTATVAANCGANAFGLMYMDDVNKVK